MTGAAAAMVAVMVVAAKAAAVVAAAWAAMVAAAWAAMVAVVESDVADCPGHWNRMEKKKLPACCFCVSLSTFPLPT